MPLWQSIYRGEWPHSWQQSICQRGDQQQWWQSIRQRTIVAKHPLRKLDDDGKVKSCRTDQSEYNQHTQASKELHQESTAWKKPRMTVTTWGTSDKPYVIL